MPLSRWKKVRQEFELKNPWWTYRKDITLLPSGKEGEYHFVHVKGSSMIIPLNDEGKMLLVNQYRYLCDRESLEFPCGSVKESSTYEETAGHELAEETGFTSNNIKLAAEFNPYNGVTDEICKVYIARDLKPTTAEHDETEEFEHVSMTPEEFDKAVAKGTIWDGMTLAAWALVRKKVLT
ncbi:MAG TPA: NUDIX hydrolase [Bacteroidota bacterium]|jgi:ADP-ribose pyrophosphatase|nr:NUDIX hydrolase [Bacteroidota bacterium]